MVAESGDFVARNVVVEIHVVFLDEHSDYFEMLAQGVQDLLNLLETLIQLVFVISLTQIEIQNQD